jgi:hypothetical protein
LCFDAASGRLTNGEMVPASGGFDPVQFQLAIDRNVSGSTSTASELHSPPVLSKVEAVSPEFSLVRSSEVDNIPAQLNGNNSSVSTRNGFVCKLHDLSTCVINSLPESENFRLFSAFQSQP